MKKINLPCKIAAAMAVSVLSSTVFAQSIVVDNTTAVVTPPITLRQQRLLSPRRQLRSSVQLAYNNADLGLPMAAPHPEIISSDANILCQVNTVGTAICGGGAPSGFLPARLRSSF